MSRPNRYKSRHSTKLKKRSFMFVGLIVGFVGAFSFLCMMFFSWTQPFPIKKVVISGEPKHISKLMLYDVMASELSGGFFGLSVSRLKENLCYLPWVKDAIVGRVWPDSLNIRLVEHEPRGIWNDRAIITMNGALIIPDNVSLLSTLPKFYGPEGKQVQIVELWQTIGNMLSRTELTVTSLELAPRGAWQLTLSNGINVRLGTQEILTRVERFVRVYDTLLYKQQDDVSYLDFRYTSGLAVGWKHKS